MTSRYVEKFGQECRKNILHVLTCTHLHRNKQAADIPVSCSVLMQMSKYIGWMAGNDHCVKDATVGIYVSNLCHQEKKSVVVIVRCLFS